MERNLEPRFEKMSKLVERTQASNPKIQKVANDLRERKDYTSHYLPKVVSMGPIHHGNPELQMGEEYKLIWAQKYIASTGVNREQLYNEVADKLDDLRSLFADNVLTIGSNSDLEGFSSFDEKLTWMLFVDGCSLLYILDSIYETQEWLMKLVSRDVLLLENQLPFMLLGLLWRKQGNLMQTMKDFLSLNYFLRPIIIRTEMKPGFQPNHLLDLLRAVLLPYPSYTDKDLNTLMEYEYLRKFNFVSYMNIQELRSNGIRLKLDFRYFPLLKISVSHRWLNGELMLPKIVLDDITIPTFLNLIAYERCPDFENDYGIGSFLAFINSLVRQPEDVKVLRSAGVLLSSYGSDEELVKLFHFLATDIMSNEKKYAYVFVEIDKHITNKWKVNTVRFLKYIRHPWTNFAIHATELALALTVIQTWFAIHPAKS